MAAGLGFKTFNTGDVLSAADVNGYLMQGVLVFADAAARTAAITSPQEGQMSFLKDTNSTEYYSGSAWVAVGGGTIPTSYGYAAGKNKIINGDFRFNQRNFTSNTTNASYNFDRFKQQNSGGTVTVTPQTFTLGTAPVAGYEGTNFVRIVSASQTLTSHYAALSQTIESVRTLAGQTATISVWAKASTGTPKIGLTVEQSFGDGGSPSSAVTTTSAAQTITSSWARYSFTVSVPSISGKTLGTTGNDGLNILLFTSCGSGLTGFSTDVGLQNVTIDFWGVQVEANSTATAFQTATGTLQGELAACQRYYFRSGGLNTFQIFGSGYADQTTTAQIMCPLTVSMRVVPTSLDFSTLNLTTGGTNFAVTGLTFNTNTSGNNLIAVYPTVASGLTTNRPYFLTANNSTSAFLGFSAEL